MSNVLTGLRILVAEDEGLVALDLEAMLAGFGVEVIGPFGSLSEAENRASGEPLDGAILDVNLRGQQSFGLARQLRSRGVPVILASGYGDAASFPEDCRTLPCLVKPYDETGLHRMAETVFGPR